MIPRARAYLKAQKAQSDWVKQLFRLHSVHGRVFAPWGVFGTTYTVPTEAEYERLKIVLSTTEQSLSIITVIMILLGSGIIPFNLTVRFMTICASCILCASIYVRDVKIETQLLSVAEIRQPFLRALRRYACEQEIWRLWFGSITFGALAGIIWLFLRNFHSGQPTLLWSIMFLLGSIALMYSLMIFLRNSSPKSESRGAT